MLDDKLRVVYSSPALTRLLGFSPEGTTALDGSRVHPDDIERVANDLAGSFTEPGGQAATEYRVHHADGTWRHVEAVATNLLDDPAVAGLVLNLHDITDRVLADEVRRAAETRFEIGFEQATIGAVISDLEGYPVRVNPAVCRLLGRPADLLVGRRWIEYMHPDDTPLGEAVLTRVAAGYDTYEDERRYIRLDGTVVWASSHVTLVRDESGEPQYFFAQLQDITGRKHMEQELAHQALHDALTGLPNRVLLTDRLVQGLAGSHRRGSHMGVMFLDVDHFKMVNDSLGHNCGDDLLRRAASQIAAAIRPGDTVARFGGDEFVVVCDDVDAGEAMQIARRVPVGVEPAIPDRRPRHHHHGQPRDRCLRRTRPRRRACSATRTRPCTGPRTGAAAGSSWPTRPCVPTPSGVWPPRRRCTAGWNGASSSSTISPSSS